MQSLSISKLLKYVAAFLALSPHLFAATTYLFSLDGGTATVSGSLNGTAFTNATWSLQGQGSTADLVTTDWGWTTANDIPLNPVITLNWLGGTLSATLTGDPDISVESRDYSFINPGHGMLGFYDVDKGAFYLDGTPAFSDFSTLLSVSGTTNIDTATYSTASGLLQILSANEGLGQFTSTVVSAPEPSIGFMVGFGSLIALISYRRRSA